MSQSVSGRSVGRRIVAVVAALFMAVGLVSATASPALAAGTGVISGTVTGTGNAPLQGISVQIFLCDPNFNPLTQQNCWTGVTTGQILTAANGSYSIPNLDPGQYTAAFFPQSGPNLNYAYEFWNNKTSLETATAFSVANGAATTISPNLQLGATISGSVFGPGGAAAPLTMVSATNTATPNQSSHAFVQSNGSYQFIGLQPGEYFLWAGPDYSAGNPSTLVREYYDNKPDAASANRFTVASGATFTANFELADGGIISGNVKNTSSANLPGIDVTIFEENQFGFWEQIKTTVTDASGNYSLTGLESGAYVVRFSDFGGTYGQRYAGNVVDRTAATEYTVGPGVNATGVNVQLSAGGGITGVITQTPTGGSATPSASAYVSIIRVNGGVHETIESLQTNASGVYTLTGLAPGNYTIQTAGGTGTWAQTYRGGYYPDQATTVAVGTTTANAGTTNVVPGTTLRGNFTDTNLAPVPSVRVKILYERSPNNWVAPPPGGGSGDINLYQISRLPPGRYIVYFEDSATTDKYVTQYYNNKPTFGTATIIEAPNGGYFDNISAQMTKTPHPALTVSASLSPASPNGSNGWYKSGNVTVTLTSGGGTVVPDKLEYKIAPATTWTAYTAPIVVNTDGTKAITYRAVEQDLQNSAEGTVTIKRDTVVPPALSSTISGRTVTVTTTADITSGVASTEYRLGTTGNWLAYTAPVNVGNAAVTIQYRSTDAAGNVSTVGSRDVPAAVGAVSLTVTSNPAAPNGTNGWYTSDVTVTGSGTAELGGTVTIASKVGAGSYSNTASRTVSSAGTTTLTFRASDSFGNQSSETPVTIKLDKVAPNATHSTSGRTVSIGATDATSSVARIEYRIDSAGAWEQYGLPVTVPETSSSLQYRAVDNAGNTSTPVTVPFTSGLPEPDRVAGANRWEAAANISQSSYPVGADVVYITSGLTFPDALSAGPAAARDSAPMLLVQPTAIPQAVLDEINRLTPDKIVVIGGPATVSAEVYTQLAALPGTIERIQGANRYEVSRNVATSSFDSASVAYIATGVNFPDALAGGGAAGVNDAPVILVNGSLTDLDGATETLLEDLGVTSIKVLGGPASVSAGIEADLNAIAPTERLAGANRYLAAVKINDDAFTEGADLVLLATGLNFPDALGGSTWAAKVGAPLYVVKQNCVPAEVLASINAMDPSEIVLLGGTSTLTPAVESLTPCP